MNLRVISLAIVSLAAISPVCAHAGADSAAMQACAAAFAATVAPAGAAPAYKLSLQDHYLSNTEMSFHTDYSFDMKVVNPKTGLASARATCLADAKGTVLSLSTVKLNDAAPALVAVF